MRLALEIPTELLDRIHPLTDFDWVLAHLVLENIEYAEFYRRSTHIKILDNSVNELLEPLSIEAIKEAAERITAIQVVAPDFLGDAEKTMESLEVTVKAFGRERVIPVVQGSSIAQVKKCFSWILNSKFWGVAVPYDILSSRESSVQRMEEGRKEVVNHIIAASPIGFNVHLLGMTTLNELRWVNRGWVKSIDTGAPVHYGLKALQFGQTPMLPKDKPTMNQMNLHWDETPDLTEVYYNIAYLRRLLSGS